MPLVQTFLLLNDHDTALHKLQMVAREMLGVICGTHDNSRLEAAAYQRSQESSGLWDSVLDSDSSDGPMGGVLDAVQAQEAATVFAEAVGLVGHVLLMQGYTAEAATAYVQVGAGSLHAWYCTQCSG